MSSTYRSPWLHQVPPRPTYPAYHQSQGDEDVVIVGGGIAGVSTAYFLLTTTDRRVALFEAKRIASGATGHNAGQMVRYFERSFAELVQVFGKERAKESQRVLEEAMRDIERIAQEHDLHATVILTQGYAGLQDVASVLRMAHDLHVQERLGIRVEELLLANDVPAIKKLPAYVRERATLLPQKDILALLETEDKRYFAALAGQKGCMNSALFCDELIRVLMEKYPDRCCVYEETALESLEVSREKDARITLTSGVTCTAKDVVLCTNGFTSFTLKTPEGQILDRWFHRTVKSSVGYMAGYLEERDLPPAAVSFLPRSHNETSAYEAPAYMYVTRRPYATTTHAHANLVCVGGPEEMVTPYTPYREQHEHTQEVSRQFSEFLATTWKRRGKKKTFDFLWHGLMGYTPDGVRLVGCDPVYPQLWYNLGCNGVGILSSVMGGKRIARMMQGEKLLPTFFDVDHPPGGGIPSREDMVIFALVLGVCSLLCVLAALLLLS